VGLNRSEWWLETRYSTRDSVVFLSLSHKCLTAFVKTADLFSSTCLDLIYQALFIIIIIIIMYFNDYRWTPDWYFDLLTAYY
jgi:hypothetical protein